LKDNPNRCESCGFDEDESGRAGRETDATSFEASANPHKLHLMKMQSTSKAFDLHGNKWFVSVNHHGSVVSMGNGRGGSECLGGFPAALIRSFSHH
jgi:hypothetical protein